MIEKQNNIFDKKLSGFLNLIFFFIENEIFLTQFNRQISHSYKIILIKTIDNLLS